MKSIMQKPKVLPPTYFMVAIPLGIIFHFIAPITRLISWPWNLLGLVPLAASGTLNLVADRAFKKLQTTVKPFEESTVLMTHSVFRLSRNPMYLGMVLFLVGEAIVLGSLSPYAVAIVFALLLDAIFIRPEEKMLEKKFGEQYLAYKQKVRRWF